MEKGVFYSGFLQDSNVAKANTGGIEGILSFPTSSLLGMQPAEVEDPPETLHSPWGVWLHHRDALHRIEQRYDTKHVLRAARAADDILHYANYVPKIGKDEDEIKPNEINFDYNYMHEEFIYGTGTKLEKEDTEDVEAATINTALEEEPTNSNDKNEGTNNNERENLSIDENLKGSHDNVKKDLVEIIKASKEV